MRHISHSETLLPTNKNFPVFKRGVGLSKYTKGTLLISDQFRTHLHYKSWSKTLEKCDLGFQKRADILYKKLNLRKCTNVCYFSYNIVNIHVLGQRCFIYNVDSV